MDKAEIVRKIKQKKELQGLADSFVLDVLNSKWKNSTDLKKSEEKKLVKLVRAELRKYAGRFVSKGKDITSVRQAIKSHSSTKERNYSQLKKIIRKINPKSILDLGCGMNPIALASPDFKYYASDIRQDILDFIKEYFHGKSIDGEVFVYDLRKIKDDLPKADLCLLLKVLDLVESRGHKVAEKIIDLVPCNTIIISFSTKTLSGKPMNHPQRGWIEQLLRRKGYSFKFIKSVNEVFYIVEKST